MGRLSDLIAVERVLGMVPGEHAMGGKTVGRHRVWRFRYVTSESDDESPILGWDLEAENDP